MKYDYSDDPNNFVEKFAWMREQYEAVTTMKELRKLTKRLKDEDGRWGPILYFHSKVKEVLQPRIERQQTPAEHRADIIFHIIDSNGRRRPRRRG